MILVIDQNRDEQTKIEKEIKSAYPDQEIMTVSNADEAMELLAKHKVDVCFMEPVNKRVSCVTIIEYLRKMKRDVKINFLADSGEYALMGWQLHINDYLVRPITRESVKHARDKAEGLTC